MLPDPLIPVELGAQTHAALGVDVIARSERNLVSTRQPTMRRAGRYFIFATARPAASYIDTVRSQYSTPYFFRILKPSSSHAPGMR